MIMGKNLFEELQERKKQLGNFAKTALQKQWIKQEEYDGIITKLENDTLTIGVIGQMKCGKSTFLNAFIFEDEVLPAATTPMTAALSVITYGSQKEISAEFYTAEEWEELKMTAERNLEEVESDAIESSKIKAARELCEKSTRINHEINQLLGKKKRDGLDNLKEYVGADGKYVAITKSVTIYYPKDWLKGVEIVDTPGFNDPVVSREIRTQDFLKKADVVLLLLYAGRAFDATDRDIVFEKIRSVGVGKVLVGVNKYDLCYEKGETIDEITDNVTNEIKKACRDYQGSAIEDLVKNEKPILFSASMALMAKMPLEHIRHNEDYKFHWDRTCDIFEISTQSQMLEKSFLSNIETAVREVIEKSKNEILFRKPVNMIWQAGMNAKENIENALAVKREELKALEMPDDELESKIDNLNKAQKRINRKAERMTEDFSEQFDDKLKEFIYSLEDTKNSEKTSMDNIIDSEKKSLLPRKIKNRWETFMSITLKRMIERYQKQNQKLVVEFADNFGDDVEDVLRKYLDSEDIIETFKSHIKRGVNNLKEDNITFYSEVTPNTNDENDDLAWYDLFWIIPSLPLVPIGMSIENIYNRIKLRDELHDKVDDLFNKINFKEIEGRMVSYKENCISLLGRESVETLLSSLLDQLEKAKGSKEEKENKKVLAQEELASLEKNEGVLQMQIEEMKRIKSQIM